MIILDASSLSPQDQDTINQLKAEVIPHSVTIDYDHYSAHEILFKLLPSGMDIPSSFETVGHIAHINLRDEHAPFKGLIGEVILSKNKQIRTVVNKIGSIDSTFRFFNMEVISGDEDTIVQVSEEGCTFKFDYAKVYWNSRLQFEHRRICHLMSKGQRVCDMFCGVGPFALPAAKRGCIVHANDLNPESIHWLRINSFSNKLEEQISIYNLDARVFVEEAIKALPANVHFDHFLMNLPASAHEFLDIFPFLAQKGVVTKAMLGHSTIHCYCFCKTEEDPIEKINSGLGYEIDRSLAQVKRVRDVAPNKEMFCVSFKLPNSIFNIEYSTAKRTKIE